MTLKDQLKEDLKTALKSGDSFKRMVLGGLSSAIKNKELEKRGKLAKSDTPTDQLDAGSQLNDEESIEVLSSELKKRRDSIAQFESANRPDLAENEKKEIEVLKVYMPEQMSEDEVKKLIDDAVASTGASSAKDMGKVMGAISAKIKGKFDGSRASAMVKEKLGA